MAMLNDAHIDEVSGGVLIGTVTIICFPAPEPEPLEFPFPGEPPAELF